jgi:hypothetical protein
MMLGPDTCAADPRTDKKNVAVWYDASSKNPALLNRVRPAQQLGRHPARTAVVPRDSPGKNARQLSLSIVAGGASWRELERPASGSIGTAG